MKQLISGVSSLQHQHQSSTQIHIQWLEVTTQVLDAAMLLSLFLVELTLFIKLKFKLDSSGTLTLLLHLIASMIRVISDIEDIGTSTFLILNKTCNTLIWLSLYYFVFEMFLVHALLTESDIQKFNKKRHFLFIMKWTTSSFFIAYAGLFIIYTVFSKDDNSQANIASTYQIANLCI